MPRSMFWPLLPSRVPLCPTATKRRCSTPTATRGMQCNAVHGLERMQRGTSVRRTAVRRTAVRRSPKSKPQRGWRRFTARRALPPFSVFRADRRNHPAAVRPQPRSARGGRVRSEMGAAPGPQAGRPRMTAAPRWPRMTAVIDATRCGGETKTLPKTAQRPHDGHA